MTFNHPLNLWWGLLAIPIVVLYLRSIPRGRAPVGTAGLWQRVLAEETVRTRWQPWRTAASLAVQLILLALLVLALADPKFSGATGSASASGVPSPGFAPVLAAPATPETPDGTVETVSALPVEHVSAAPPAFGSAPAAPWFWASLVGVVLMALAAEWCLYQRRWTS